MRRKARQERFDIRRSAVALAKKEFPIDEFDGMFGIVVQEWVGGQVFLAPVLLAGLVALLLVEPEDCQQGGNGDGSIRGQKGREVRMLPLSPEGFQAAGQVGTQFGR